MFRKILEDAATNCARCGAGRRGPSALAAVHGNAAGVGNVGCRTCSQCVSALPRAAIGQPS